MANNLKFGRNAVIAAIAIALTQVSYADLKNAKRVFESGNWSVMRDIDAMTDKVGCTGIYKSNNGIQLTPNALYVTVRGGLQSVTLRYGDKEPRRMRLPTEMEKKIGAVMIDGSDFSELLEANRLRLQSLTLVRNVAQEDLDLTGLGAAVENIRAGCPEAEKVAAPPVVAPPTTPEKPVAPAADAKIGAECSPTLIARMKAKGLKDKLIAEVCGK